jgi:hypothetical protein
MRTFENMLFELTGWASMTKSQWFKYGNDRLDVLRQAIVDGDPLTLTSGEDVMIAGSTANLKIIDDYTKLGDEAPATFTLKLKKKGEVVSNELGKSPIFGGKGKGGGATGITANGESLQCLFLAAMLGEGVDNYFSHFTPALLESYYNKIDVDVKIADIMASGDAWFFSAYVTARYLIRKQYVTAAHTLHRGSSTMKAIYRAKRIAFKNSGQPVLNDDKWNPGDIWAVKKGADISKLLDTTTVDTLNADILKAYDNKTIVGISLKQIASLDKKAKSTEYNRDDSILDKHKFNKVRLKSDGKNSTVWSLKGGIIIFDGSTKMDFRAPSAMGAINVEIIGKGARGGRAGYGQITYAAKAHMKLDLPSNATIKSEAQKLLGGKSRAAANKFYKMTKVVEKDMMSKDDFMEELKTTTIDRIHANLAAAYLAHGLLKSTSKQRNDFVTHMVNYAASKTNDSSIYIKISA